MRKKWADLAIALSVSLSLLAPAGLSRAAGTGVSVTLPDFTVQLNGHTVENQYREYPLLVYRGITYFPMTWYDSRLLGLGANWSPDDGLSIKQGPVTSSYAPYRTDSRNAAAYKASVLASAVTVNGKPIDNANEEYPLLSFRNITYFPLTWRFAHDEFGWEYQWSDTEGLSITSHNPQLQTVGLPPYSSENNVALFKGYYYFAETTDKTNHVYRAPIDQPTNKEEIYSYDIESSYGLQKSVSFQIRDNGLWLTYHLGGAIMGHDEFVKINDDGTTKLSYTGYLDFMNTPYGTLIIYVDLTSAFGGGNLYLIPPGEERNASKAIGDPNLMYAVRYHDHGGSSGGSAANLMAVNGDDLYVFASRSETDANNIYRINLKTDKTVKIIDSDVNWFKVIDNKLIYVKDEDKALYSSALDGTGETRLSDHAVAWFDSIGGHIFYTVQKDWNQLELYKADPDGDDPLLWNAPFTSVQRVNGQLVCLLDDGAQLFDSSGAPSLSIAGPVSQIFPSDEGLLLRSGDSPIIRLR